MGRPAAEPKPCKVCGKQIPIIGRGRPALYCDEHRPVKNQLDAGRNPRGRKLVVPVPIALVPSLPPEPKSVEERIAVLYRCVDLGAEELVRVLEGKAPMTPIMPGALPNLILSTSKAITLLSGGIQPSFGDMIFTIPDPNQPITERVVEPKSVH